MEFILVRHGEPEEAALSDGPADPGLSEKGKAQARALADCSALGPVDLIVQSPARRAVETAAPLARARGIIPVTVPDLAECDWGVNREYVRMESLQAAGDPRYLHWVLTGDPGDGTDVPAFRERVIRTFASLAAANPGKKRVVAVSHNGVLNAYLGDVVGMSPLLWIHLAYTSYSRVAAARDGRRGILSLNETPHLINVGSSG